MGVAWRVESVKELGGQVALPGPRPIVVSVRVWAPPDVLGLDLSPRSS